jgi:diguanylate cyclase (GGDEF)-like protein
MDKKLQVRSEKEFIVMGLSLTYAACVGVFAVIRFLNHEVLMSTLDGLLAVFGLYVFVYVWKTGLTKFPSYAIVVISIIGTLATIYLKGAEQVFWVYPTVAFVFYLLPPRHATIMWLISLVMILVLLKNLPLLQLVSIGMTVFITSFFCYLFSSKMYEQNDRLRKQANQDVLTQIKNRRAFNYEMTQIENETQPISAILFDLDNFKQVNDYYGHSMGDQVLYEAASEVESLLQNRGHLYRIGGDEFAILCQGMAFNEAFQLANSIHQEFLQNQLHNKHNITLSLAVAQKESDESVKDWLKRLDSALYKAKKSGRNQIVKAIRY